MASVYHPVADSMPYLGMVNGPWPVSPIHPTGTLAPRDMGKMILITATMTANTDAVRH